MKQLKADIEYGDAPKTFFTSLP